MKFRCVGGREWIGDIEKTEKAQYIVSFVENDKSRDQKSGELGILHKICKNPNFFQKRNCTKAQLGVG